MPNNEALKWWHRRYLGGKMTAHGKWEIWAMGLGNGLVSDTIFPIIGPRLRWHILYFERHKMSGYCPNTGYNFDYFAECSKVTQDWLFKNFMFDVSVFRLQVVLAIGCRSGKKTKKQKNKFFSPVVSVVQLLCSCSRSLSHWIGAHVTLACVLGCH